MLQFIIWTENQEFSVFFEEVHTKSRLIQETENKKAIDISIFSIDVTGLSASERSERRV